jgi:predicted secreted protein
MRLIFSFLLLFLSVPALAQTPVQTINPGETIITLSATEQVELKQDTLNGSLRIEEDGKSAREIQDKINAAMKKAVEIAKENKDIKVSTGQYSVYAFDPNPQPPKPLSAAEMKKRQVWRGSQTIDISGKNQDAVLEVVGKIQELGFAMNGLNYYLSSEQQESYRDTLMTQALKTLQKRADVAAKALGRSNFDIIEVNVDGGYMPAPPVMMRAAKMDMAAAGVAESMAAPVAEAGNQNISLTVNARILLRK